MTMLTWLLLLMVERIMFLYGQDWKFGRWEGRGANLSLSASCLSFIGVLLYVLITGAGKFLLDKIS